MQITRNIAPEFVDERGEITKLLDDGKTSIKSVLLITSKTGAIRANHYHKEDSHHVYLISGKMEYTEAPLINGEPDHTHEERVEVSAGDSVYSPPMTAHAMKFLEDSVFIVLAMKSRSHENYEDDTVRVTLI